MLYDLVLDNCKIHPFKGNYYLGIEEGKIKNISRQPLKADNHIDIEEKLILPGLIDAHVHFRDPGLTYKEDFKSGSQAAAHGGFTSILDMPNTIPPTNTAKNFQEKIDVASKKSIVDFGLHAGVDNLEEIEKISTLNPASFKLFMDLVDDHFLVQVFEKLSRIAPKPLLTLHAENKDLIEHYREKLQAENKKEPQDYCLVRPAIAEEMAVAQALSLSHHYQHPTHICHLSSDRSLQLINYMQEKACPVSSEITPHHLFLDSNDYKKWGNIAKTNPPLRSPWVKIPFSKLDKIDMIATDHAPHTLEEKEKGLWEASPGIPNLETVLSLLLTQFHKKNINLEQIKSLLCENPARIFNLKNKGFIKKGMDADLVVVDLKLEGAFKVDDFYTKAPYTPFSGWKYQGAAIMTISQGKVIMEEGQVFKNKGHYIYPL